MEWKEVGGGSRKKDIEESENDKGEVQQRQKGAIRAQIE